MKMNHKTVFLCAIQLLVISSLSFAETEVTSFYEEFLSNIDELKDFELQLPEGATETIGNHAAQYILKNILLPTLKAKGEKSALNSDTKIPILPPFLDEITLPIPDGGLNIPVNIEQLMIGSTELNVTGDLNITSGAISGFSTVQDDLELGLPILSIYYKLWFDELRNLIGHDTLLDIYTNLPIPPLQYINIIGTGDLELNVTGGTFNISITIDADDKLNVTKFYAGLDIEALHISPVNLEDIQVFASGSPMEFTEETWAGVSSLLSGSIKGLLEGLLDELNTLIKTVLNEILKGCTIQDIIGGDLTCLPFVDPLPTSTENLITQSTTEMETTTSSGVGLMGLGYIGLIVTFAFIKLL